MQIECEKLKFINIGILYGMRHINDVAQLRLADSEIEMPSPLPATITAFFFSTFQAAR